MRDLRPPARRPGRARRWSSWVSILLAGTGLAVLGGQGWLKAKAALASVLIDRAWEARLADGREHRPWPWADMRPVARLEVPRLGIARAVLSGASGESLAFGLAHVSGTAHPGEPGNAAIAGHRDTWAGFLKDLRSGDEVILITPAGGRTYVVEEISVVGKGQVEVLEPTGADRLTLITCYPFSGLLRSPWRCLITCRPAKPRSLSPRRRRR